MRYLKKVLTPIVLVALVLFMASFKTYSEGQGNECKIKIIKMINGKKTVVDSAFFDCDKSINNNPSLMKEMDRLLQKAVKNWYDSTDIDMDDEDAIRSGLQIDYVGKDIEVMMDEPQINDQTIKIDIDGEEIEFPNEAYDTLNNKVIREENQVTRTFQVTKKNSDNTINLEEKAIIKGKKFSLFNGSNIINVGVNSKTYKFPATPTFDKRFKKGVTKINEEKKGLTVNKLKFSPNPSNGRFNLAFSLSDNKPFQVRIFDVQGKEIYSEEVLNVNEKYAKEIDISDNEKGIYILQIAQGDKTKNSKLVIE